MRKHHFLAFGLLTAFIYVAGWALATPPQPGWWTDTTNGTAILNGNTANDQALANLGQVKFVASQAKKYLDFKLSGNGGAGPDINALVFSFSPDPQLNLSVVNNGQLKYVAQVFYDRLFGLGYNISGNISNTTFTVDGLPGNWTFTSGNATGSKYPWRWVAPGGTSPPLVQPGPHDVGYNGTVYAPWLQNQYAPASLGQLKFVFSFDLGNLTSNTAPTGPTSGNFRGRVLSSPISGTDDGDDADDTFTIDGTGVDMPSLPIPQYARTDIGTGQLVDMNDAGNVLIKQTYTDDFLGTNYTTNYTYWYGDQEFTPPNDGTYINWWVNPLPGNYYIYIPNAYHYLYIPTDDTIPLADNPNTYAWYRVTDDGGLAGSINPAYTIVPFTYPAYWSPGMSEPTVLDMDFVQSVGLSANVGWTFVYADNLDNQYYATLSDDTYGNIVQVINWAADGTLSVLATHDFGNDTGDANVTINLATVDGHTLDAVIPFNYTYYALNLEGGDNYGNISALLVDGTTVAGSSSLAADPASLISYAHQFTEWADESALGGSAPSASIRLGSSNVTLYDHSGGTSQYITSLSAQGIATTGNGTYWADNQTWGFGNLGIWVDQVTADDVTMVGHYGSSSTMDNSTGIVLLTPTGVSSDGMATTLSTSEFSGASHRKIALNGRPLPDGKPQTAPESDHQPEETFIDALTLGLRHNVTDLYTPVAGTELPLSVTRVYNEEVWDIGAGLQPTEHYLPIGIGNTAVAHTDWPFGPGWRSNITPNVRLEYKNANLLDAFVTDEDGQEYHFIGGYIHADLGNGTLSANETFNFVPYPTGQHEKNTFLATLSIAENNTLYVDPFTGLFFDGNATLTFAKKYGTSVTYTYASNLTQATTTAGGSPYETFVYFRAEHADDRLGYRLNYDYPNNSTLVPEDIYMGDATANHTAIPGAYMNITTYSGNVAWNGLVENITDADGKKTTYTYGTFADSTNTTTAELTNVEDAASGNVSYDYDFMTEHDRASYSFGYPGHIPFYNHLAVANITDQNDHKYHFDYGFSYTTNGAEGFYSTSDGVFFPETGRPLVVQDVVLPNGAMTDFDPHTMVKVVNSGARLNLVRGPDGFSRNLTVTDADGNKVVYTWAQPKVVAEDPPPALQSGTSGACVVLYMDMTMDYLSSNGTDLGMESFTFSPTAGMAVIKATDLGGATTEYTYGDTWNAPKYYKQILPDVAELTGNYDDPTEEFDANFGIKTFKYNSFRLMSDIVDPNGNLTHYVFDNGGNLSKGLRTAEQHYVGNTTGGTLVAETDYTYGNTTFPAALIQKNIKSLSGDPGWAANLTTNFTLTSAGRVASEIVDPSGLALTTSHTYSNTGDLLSTEDARGNFTNMTYDNRHRLTEVSYVTAGTSKNYTYDARGNELSEEDENGHFTNKVYDSLNRVSNITRVVTGGNLVTAYTYSNTSVRLSVTDPLGGTTSYTYDGLNRLTKMSTPAVKVNGGSTAIALNTTYSYDSGNVGGSVFDTSSFKPTSVTDARGFVTNFTYDGLGHVLTQSTEYDTSGYGTFANITNTYDPNGNLQSKTDAVQTANFTYDALNRLIVTTHLADNSTITANYTSTGLAYLKTDELGRETQMEYDHAGRPTEVLQPDATYGNISGNSPTTTTTYDANGNVLTVTDPDSNEKTFTYDSRNRRTKTTFPAAADWLNSGTSTAGNISTTYDAAGNVLTVTNQLGQVTTTAYDEANRPTDVFTPAVNVWNGTGTTSLDLVTHSVFDKNGNVLHVEQGTATSASTGAETLSRNTTDNVFDALNRLSQTTDGANVTVAYQYDENGNRITVTQDPSGLNTSTTYTFDGLNRVLTIDYPVGNETVYTYDPTHVDSVSFGPTGFTYYFDERDRMRFDGIYYYFHDYAGEVVGQQDYSSEFYTGGGGGSFYPSVYYVYDGDGRVIQESQAGYYTGYQSGNTIFNPGTYGDTGNFSGNMSGGVLNSYTYDKAGNRLSAVYGVGTGNRTLNSAYDALNRLGNITDVTSGNIVTTYHYDLAGHRVGLLYPSGSNITTTFDAVGRQTEIKGTGNATTTRYDFNLSYDQYNNLGKQAETYANGTLVSRNVTLAYDGADRLTQEALVIGSTNITSNYTYDKAYNRTGKATLQIIGGNTGNETTEANITYHYDAANELTYYHDTVGNVTANFTYDGAGNRVKKFLSTATWPNATVAANLTTAAFAQNYAYETDYYYDGHNRLDLVDLKGNYTIDPFTHTSFDEQLSYGYDAQNRRVGRVDWHGDWPSGGNTTDTWQHEIYDGDGPVRDYSALYSYDNTTVVGDYVRGSDWGGGIGGVLYSVPSSGNGTNTAKYYHYDGRGDVVALTSNTGAVSYQAAYDAYGTHGNISTKGTEESGTDADMFRLTTKEEDPWGGSYQWNRELFLDSNTWGSKDPMGQAAGANVYTYVNQNNWTKTDPEGEFVGEIIDGGFFAWDTVSYGYYAATGQHGKAALAATNVGIDVAGAVLDLGDGGMGGGTAAIAVARTAAKAKFALQAASAVGHTIQAGQQTNAAVNAVKADSAGDKPSGDPSASAKSDKEGQTPQDRGRESEKRVLDDKGEAPNKDKVSGTEGNSVPDFINDKEIGEIKDTKKISDSSQLRIQREVAQAQGKDHTVVTGDNTKVSKTVLEQSKVERRSDLGPQNPAPSQSAPSN